MESGYRVRILRSAGRWTSVCTFVLGLSAMAVAPAGWLSREEALAAAYPGAVFTMETLFLSRQQVKEAEKLAGEKVSSALWARYTAVKEGREVGRAYVDTHVVRTKKESLLICLDARGAVVRIEVIAFLEPPEYQASAAWYSQYNGKVLSDELHLERAIRTVAGATRTAISTNGAVRRVLAIDHVLTGLPSHGQRP